MDIQAVLDLMTTRLSSRFSEYGASLLVDQVEPLIERALSAKEGRKHEEEVERGPVDDELDDLPEDVEVAQEAVELEGSASAAEAKPRRKRKRDRFQFEKTDLGSVAPRVTDIVVHPRNSDRDEIVADFGLQYLGDCDLQVKILGIRSGVR
jgi:hypothetical protein